MKSPTVVSRLLTLSIAISIGFTQSGCKVLLSQNPRDSFADGKMPRQLSLIANQEREASLKLREEIIQRVKRDKLNPNLIEVAVIDSGLDIWHEDLRDQLAYDIKDDKIVGVGKDIMAKDAVPSYVMVDPTLFAFGAEAVKDGLIVKAPESPLAEMKKINDRFTQILLEEIKNNPEIIKSLFARLQPGTFTIFGMSKLLKSWNEYDSLSDYKKNKEKFPERYVDVNTKYLGDKDAVTDLFVDEAQKGWNLNQEENIPFALDNATRIVGFDHFHAAITRAFEKINAEMNFQRHVQQVKDYLTVHLPDKNGRADKGDIDDAFEKLSLETGAYLLLGYKAYDPLEKIRAIVAKIRKNPTMTTKEAIADLPTVINETIQGLDKLIGEEEKKEIPAVRRAFDTLLQAVSQMSILTENTVEGDKARSAFRRYAIRNHHPYIASETLSNQHHTHVASIIAKQNPNIRIYPIKVVTQTVASPVEQKEIFETTIGELSSWLQMPLIKKLIAQVEKEYGVKQLSEEQIKRAIYDYLKANGLNVLFVHQVLEAIKTVGQRKIKLANVSLGTLFEKEHAKSKTMESIAEDLFAEFVRYQIGETIEKHAPKSVFFVATGNEKAWVDGVSRSAFPVGITSLRLKQISEREKLSPAPNNRVRNVVAVGSVNPNQGTMTSFSNLLIDPYIPQIFSTGEEIMGAIPSRAGGIQSKVADETLKPALKALRSFDQAVDNWKENKGQVKSDPKFHDLIINLLQLKLMGSFVSLEYPTFLKSQFVANRQELSGTSMATPSAIGQTADEENKLQIKLGVKTEEVYDHPEFAHEKLILRLFAATQKSDMSQTFDIRMLIKELETWQPSKGEEKLKKFVGEVKAKSESIKCLGLF